MQLNGSLLRIIAFQACIHAILIFSCLLYQILDLYSETLIYPACLLLVALTIWFFWSWKILTKKLFDPYTLFIMSAVIFNGGQAFLEVFHLNQKGFLGGKFSSETLLETLFIVILGLASFHFGALLSAGTGKAISPEQSCENKASFLSQERNCRVVGWSLLAISFLPTIWVGKDAIVTVMQSGYAAFYQDIPIGFNNAPFLLSNFIIPSIMFLLAGSKGRRNVKKLCVFSVLFYIISRFFIGQRNTAVMPLIAFAWLWHNLIRTIPRSFIFGAAAVILFIVFPVVEATRNVAGENRLSINFLLNAYSSVDNPLIASISEMGLSMQTVAYTIELVPRFKNFDMGAGYFYALLTLVPNFFWKIHPAEEHGIPSTWLTWEVEPLRAAVDGGLGFSFIAEAYLNFGWWGTPIILAAIGFLFGKLTLWAVRSGEPAKMAMLASFISFFLFYTRAQAADIIRPLGWYSFLPYLGVLRLSSSRSKAALRSGKV